MADSDADKFDLVCEGGGVKGIGLAGAYAVLEEQGHKVQSCAGTSAGAITAALIAAGYTSDELNEVIFGLDYRRFEDPTWEKRVGGALPAIVFENGMYKGDVFEEWMRGKLAEKDVHTFADLPPSQDSSFNSRLQVVASDVSAHELLVLPRDAAKLGTTVDKLEVAHAVRMSMSIPIFFEPVRFENEATNHQHVIVDGGMLSNFPVWLFDRTDGQSPRWPTFGLLLVEPDPKIPITQRLPEPEKGVHGPSGLVNLVSSMVHTMMEAHDRLYVEKAQYARTIPIPTLGVGTTEFNITPERTKALYESGRKAAEDFLKSWDFEAYKAAFRSGTEPPSRRESLVAELAG
ncbi:MAG TPA: patatin-like phospholipase family protein [Thermoleophilaceae bacterium]|jgi:NTE family protein